MKIQELASLEESSGYSLEGSFTPDLVFSKLWLLRELAKIRPHCGTMYVLGSWYGNLALLLSQRGQPRVDHVINVETNKKFLRGSQELLKQFGVDNVEPMLKNANSLDYRQLDHRGVVVNTSLTDMQGTDWFENIPSGTLVALQGRDHDPNRNFNTTEDITKRFPLSQVLYSGAMELEDPETRYTRYMVIGIK